MDDNLLFFNFQRRIFDSKLTQDMANKLFAMRQSGLSLKSISTKTGIPKSTVALYLKKSTDTLEPSNARSIVQDYDCTKQNTIVLDDSWTSIDSWKLAAKTFLLLLPVISILPWLITSSAQIYAKDVGFIWGWAIAVGLETFIVALAVLAPKLNLDMANPKAFVATLIKSIKVVAWYLMLLAMVFFSYKTLSFSVKEQSILSTSSIASVANNNTFLQELKERRLYLQKSIANYEDKGWIGAANKLRDDLRTVDERVDNLRSTNNPIVTQAMSLASHKEQISSALRMIALLINAFCLHLIVKLWSSKKADLICSGSKRLFI